MLILRHSAGDDEELFESEDNFDGFMEKGQDDGSKFLDDQHEQTHDTDCKVCKQRPCLSGQFLTENIKDPVGLRVKATFTSESRARSLSSSTFAFKASSFQGKC